MGRILLTGATGFIGSHIAELFAAQGIDCACLVRPRSSRANLAGIRVECRHGDLLDRDSIRRALNGVGMVVHAAGHVRDWGAYATFYEANVKGTVNMLEMCHECGIADVVITGSVSSYGEENCPAAKDETSPYNSHYPYLAHRILPSALNHYRDTKAEATRDAVRFAGGHGMNLTVIEPVWVYGEREFHTGFYEYVKAAKQGVPFVPGSRANRFHVIYARDLARAYLAACEKRLCGVHRIIVGNDRADSMDLVFATFCRYAGVRKPRSLPKWTLYPVAFALELLFTALRSPTPPILTRSRVNMFYDTIEYATRRSRELLGFSPRFSLEQGIEATVAWYKKNGYL
jgi:nucleoside-diphosphate-sugar epimerase